MTALSALTLTDEEWAALRRIAAVWLDQAVDLDPAAIDLAYRIIEAT